MNRIIYLLFLSIFLFDYLSGQMGILSHYVTWLPEILSLVVLVMVVILFAVDKKPAIHPKYILFLAAYIVLIFIGVVLNAVPEGPLVAGLRTYLKFVPFFLLPAAYAFSDKQIQSQLKFLLFLLLLQVPLVLYQRLIQYKGVLSGDPMKGMLGNSGQLAIVLSCTITAVIACYLYGKLSRLAATLLVILLFIPITVGETKASLVILPIALIAPFILYKESKGNIKRLLTSLVICTVAMSIFFVIYDYFMTPLWGYGLMDFLTMEGRMEGYLYRRADAEGDLDKLGRFDTLLFAVKILSQDFFQLLFGLGVGNVSGSFLSGASGEYAAEYAKYGINGTNVTLFLWEIGLLGTSLYFIFFWFVFKDARALSQYKNMTGALALAWSIVVLIFIIGMFYKQILGPNVSGYLFWYWSGYIVASYYRTQLKSNDAKQ